MDPVGISLFGFVRNILYLLVIFAILNVVVDHMFVRMNNEMGIAPNDIWAEIRKNNLAAGVYLGCRVASVLIGGSVIAAAFIR
jgi:hypothetical protein